MLGKVEKLSVGLINGVCESSRQYPADIAGDVQSTGVEAARVLITLSEQ
jgi:hypothetical protein